MAPRGPHDVPPNSGAVATTVSFLAAGSHTCRRWPTTLSRDRCGSTRSAPPPQPLRRRLRGGASPADPAGGGAVVRPVHLHQEVVRPDGLRGGKFPEPLDDRAVVVGRSGRAALAPAVGLAGVLPPAVDPVESEPVHLLVVLRGAEGALQLVLRRLADAAGDLDGARGLEPEAHGVVGRRGALLPLLPVPVGRVVFVGDAGPGLGRPLPVVGF